MKHKTNGTHTPRASIAAAQRLRQSTSARTAAVAGAAAFGVGAVTSIIVMRRPIGRALSAAAAQGAALATRLPAPSRLLVLAGLRRQPSPMWAFVPVVGASLAAIALGSAVVFWLTRDARREKATLAGGLSVEPVVSAVS